MTTIPLDAARMPFLKIILGYLIGVVLAQWITWSPTLLAATALWVIALTLLLFTAFLLSMPAILLTALLYASWISIGVWQYARVIPESSTYFVGSQNFLQLIGDVSEEPLQKGNNTRLRINLLGGIDSLGNSHRVSGRVLLTVYHDSIAVDSSQGSRAIHYGDRIQFPAKLIPVSPPRNPKEFDYRKFLANRGIYHQQAIRPSEMVLIASNMDWYGYVLQGKEQVVRRFKENMTDQQAFSVAAALVFGYRAELNPEVYAAFAHTGTVHILSVSGMHVSMVFMLLTFLLRPLDRWRYGRSSRFLVIFLFIWGYVVLTGMAPPILRAGIMISCYLCSQWLGRRQQGLNALFVSGFLILWFDPRMLFEIGFQLSYLAMIGIFLIFPMLRKCYVPKNRWAKLFLDYSCISIAAQLITTPMTLFYFGQFPNYFLLANLLITLPATMVMYFGVALMLVPIPMLSVLLGRLQDVLVNSLVRTLQWINNLPGATWQDITVVEWQVVAMFAVIAALFVAVNYRSKTALYAAVILLHVLIVGGWVQQKDREGYQGIHIYQLRKQVAIASFEPGWVNLFTTLDSLNHPSIQYSVMPDLTYYRSSARIRFIKISSDQNFLLTSNNKSILVINQQHLGNSQQADIVLLRNNVVLLDGKHDNAVGQYIVDGSNWGYRLQETTAWLDRQKLSYYLLKDNFAYVWDTR